MSTLFVANCTKQVHDFRYWRGAGDAAKLIRQTIAPGTQTRIEGERPFLDSIVAGHKAYGLIERSEIKNAKRFSGQCYQFERPVDIDAIYSGIELVGDTAQMRANEVRQEGAAAQKVNAEKTAAELTNAMGGDGSVSVGTIETQITQISEAQGNAERFTQTVVADASQAGGQNGGERRRPGRR